VTHYFSDGVYAREIRIPAGTLAHRQDPQADEPEHPLGRGDLGAHRARRRARARTVHVVSPAGTKRLAYTHTDVTWTTIHGTHERDLDKIEEDIHRQSEDDFLGYVRGLEEREAA
jgi:hypothetical protein